MHSVIVELIIAIVEMQAAADVIELVLACQRFLLLRQAAI